jgi:hypothetical protein
LLAGWFHLVAYASVIHAQASPFVPLGAPVYRDIDLLTSAGLIDTLAGAARPYTRREIRRLLAEARRKTSERGSSMEWAERVVERDLARYSGDHRTIDYAAVDLALTDSPDRPAPSDFNGSIDAAINPLAAGRGGRPIADGATLGVETMHSLSLGRHVALALSPRLTLEHRRTGGDGFTGGRLQSASATFLFGNLVAEAGRDYVAFGPSPAGGLLLSTSAPSLDMLRVSTQRPAALPWVLRHLGPASGMLVVADLGRDRQIHPHAKLVGYHMAIAPHRNLELGVSVIDETGGQGAPPASFADRVVDAIPIVDAWRTGSDFQFSNKLAGGDARWRMPSWAGLEVYAEGDLDDLDIRRLRSSLLQDGGLIAGASLDCLVECGRLAATLEYHQTGIRYYTHTEFGSGIQAHGIMLGDPLGPRGIGGYATLEGEVGGMGRLALSSAYEVRSGNRYGSAGQGSHSADFHFVLIERRPAERRTRLVATWTARMPGARADLVVSGGAERILNFNFAGAARTTAIGQLGYRVWP